MITSIGNLGVDWGRLNPRPYKPCMITSIGNLRVDWSRLNPRPYKPCMITSIGNLGVDWGRFGFRRVELLSVCEVCGVRVVGLGFQHSHSDKPGRGYW